MEKYSNAAGMAPGESVDALLGFNANIDVIYSAEEIETDGVEASKAEKVTSLEELRAALKYCLDEGVNREIPMDMDELPGGGEERVGGQAAIMSNYLANLGDGAIFYTPFLSEEIAKEMDEKVLYPTTENGEFVLKNVKDAVNSDRTKRNLIFEFSGEETGRIIFSSDIKGFGPYFREGVEDNLDRIDENVDRVLLAGFHNASGNAEAKIIKSRDQVEKIETPVHMEYVHRDDDKARLVLEHILPEVDSIGLDGEEVRSLARLADLEADLHESLTPGDAFHISRQLVEDYGTERVHIHTSRFQIVVVGEDYPVGKERLRDALLFGQLSAVTTCEKGELPVPEDFEGLDMEDKHIHPVDELADFQDFFGLESFVETGTAEIDGYRVAAVPALVHENPRRLVGLGDVISCGSFVAEVKQ